jgi:hypothetical protein
LLGRRGSSFTSKGFDHQVHVKVKSLQSIAISVLRKGIKNLTRCLSLHGLFTSHPHPVHPDTAVSQLGTVIFINIGKLSI